MFVVLYIFFNMRNLRDGDIFNGSDIKKPLLITLIGTLLFYLYMTWEEEDKVPSYSIANNKLNMNNLIGGKNIEFNKIKNIDVKEKIIYKENIVNELKNKKKILIIYYFLFYSINIS